jgi:disulfide bond formation protein DsbB
MSSLATRGRVSDRSEAYSLGAGVLVAATAIILTALGFEYIGNYLPCPLCLQQRYAYYATIPLSFFALVMLSSGRLKLASLVFVLIGLAFFANTGLGIYQSGAEWAWWPGPQSCGTIQKLGTGAGGVLDKLDTTKVIKCDEAQWRFAELSFAGWNALFSALLALTSLRAAAASAKNRN